MGKITIVNIDDCIACGACAGTCPQSVLEVNDHVEIKNPDDCIGCGACVDVCPQGVLKVE
ncbi:hypothetical protein ENUP19_0259G0049 [Entamoeba nuttalli]|uniref:Ferredoxin, putative n=2 Tax=Entamoeba nuttalli TaxID=412467 RepID=K2GRD5_ENTNP|nr:ferredoxin, putative [Entamoeba nuttalli P19]EKE37523.1 ferredoxin, putative [Entamoeba nuttalli P19]|eukprot:XP_008860149.1 ferredoxin, putative [Entamoeba nuttalli P19]